MAFSSLGYFFFVFEILIFLHYANEESDNIIGALLKHSMKNISRNIKAVFFKLGTKTVHQKRNKMTAIEPQP